MARWLAFIALVLALAAFFPWQRESPRHRFIFDQLKRLQEAEPEERPPVPAEEAHRELDSGAGVHHGVGSTHV